MTREKPSSGISLGRVTTQLLLSRAAGSLLAVGNSVIVARVLGVDRLGTYAYARGIAALFGFLPHMGIATVVTREIARNPDTGTGVLRAALSAQALLAGGVILAIPAFAAILPAQPVPLSYVALAAAQLAVGTLSLPYLAVVAGRAGYDRLAASELVLAGGGTLFLLVAAALHGSVTAFLWAHVLAAGFAVVVARRVATPFLSVDRGQSVPLGALFRQATPFGVTVAVQSLYTRLDILLLGQMASTAALGLYSAAYKPVNLAIFFGATVAGTLFPLMARPSEEAVPVAFERAVRGLCVAGPTMALMLSGLAGPLLRVLYGTEFAGATPILVLLAWSAAANWLYAPLGIALQARGKEQWWLSSLMGGLVLNAIGNFWAIPRWGAVGAAGATLLSEVALLAMGAALVRRQLGIPLSLRPVLIAVGASAGGSAVLWALMPSGALPATLTAVTVCVALLVVFGVATVRDASLVVGWVRQATLRWSRG
ncbi:MAG: flippase [Anaerolineae bacterium]